MLKKLIPIVLLAFITACANAQGTSNNAAPCPHCKTCEYCKSHSGQCCKDGQCSCCKDKQCQCHKAAGAASSVKGDDGCPVCRKAREAQQQAK